MESLRLVVLGVIDYHKLVVPDQQYSIQPLNRFYLDCVVQVPRDRVGNESGALVLSVYHSHHIGGVAEETGTEGVFLHLNYATHPTLSDVAFAKVHHLFRFLLQELHSPDGGYSYLIGLGGAPLHLVDELLVFQLYQVLGLE
eukprot:CAMPEP_0170544178 /NCGR_PEP_ID=MMETSP0211-20121228/3045_1 /TAXON_ID=311385 /ORGANISM="Pseudokeronopsis sp., Strain OXSARD2" /LENGTH=141 /DNA_ID=CAMNT_0010847775 /DNA_START=162 /DNA_END=587 /DNA_ORIENTATION=+